MMGKLRWGWGGEGEAADGGERHTHDRARIIIGGVETLFSQVSEDTVQKSLTLNQNFVFADEMHEKEHSLLFEAVIAITETHI